MKNKLLIFIFIFTIGYLKAQNKDSLSYYLQQYDYEKAIHLINKTNPDHLNVELLYTKAIAYKGLSKYQEAIEVLEEILKRESSNSKAIIELAECYLSMNNFKNAQNNYQKALKLNPDNRYLVQQLANSYFMDDQYRQAIQYYSINYSNDPIYYLCKQLARCFENLELIDSAIWFYKKAYRLNPDDAQLVYRLGNIYKDISQYKVGASLTNQYLNNYPYNLKILKLSGLLNYLDGDYLKSTIRFERSLQLKDTSLFVIKYLGYSLFKAGKFDQSIHYLDKAFNKDTTNTNTCYFLGFAYSKVNYKHLGIFYLNKAIELMKASPDLLSHVYQDLADVYKDIGDSQEALNAYLSAYEINQNDTLLIYKLGSHYDHWINNKEMALKYYEKFILTRPAGDKPLPEIPGAKAVSYYEVVEKRMNELKEEQFWNGKKEEK